MPCLAGTMDGGGGGEGQLIVHQQWLPPPLPHFLVCSNLTPCLHLVIASCGDAFCFDKKQGASKLTNRTVCKFKMCFARPFLHLHVSQRDNFSLEEESSFLLPWYLSSQDFMARIHKGGLFQIHGLFKSTV